VAQQCSARACAGAYSQVGYTYGAGGSPAIEEAAAPGQSAGAAAEPYVPEPYMPEPYVPRFSVPLPARLAGALPGSARELKVRPVSRLRSDKRFLPLKGAPCSNAPALQLGAHAASQK